MKSRRLESSVDRMRANNDVIGLLKTLKESDCIGVAGAVEDALEEIGHRTVKPFIGALNSKDAFVRSGAAWTLGNIKDSSTVELLIETLKYEDENVRWLVLAALGDIGDERAIDPVSIVRTGNDEFLREMVAETLEKIRSRCLKEI
jgi:HEAT repeat protein